MIAIYFYLVTLLIAPQLWIPPFIGVRTDFLCFPLLILAVLFSKNLTEAIRLKTADVLLLAFVVWITLSAITNGWTPESQAQVIFYWKMFVMFKLMTTILQNTERTKKAALFFVILTSILAIEAIYHKLNPAGLGWAGQKLGWIDPDAIAAGEKGRARWIGIFEGQGVFAVLFPVAVAFPLCAGKISKSVLNRLLLMAVIVLLTWGLYCTGSRGGFLAILAVFGVYFLIHSRFRVLAGIIFAGLVVLLIFIAPDYLTTVRDQSNSTQYRVEMWAAGLDMLKNNPLFGIGIHNFYEWTGKLIAHNSAIELMGETGGVGFLLWISLIYYNAKGLIVRLKEATDEKDRWFFTALLLALMGYMVSSMFVTLEYETIYILLSWCAVAGRDPNGKTAIFSKWDPAIIFFIAVGFIAFVQVFAIVFLQ